MADRCVHACAPVSVFGHTEPPPATETPRDKSSHRVSVCVSVKAVAADAKRNYKRFFFFSRHPLCPHSFVVTIYLLLYTTQLHCSRDWGWKAEAEMFSNASSLFQFDKRLLDVHFSWHIGSFPSHLIDPSSPLSSPVHWQSLPLFRRTRRSRCTECFVYRYCIS